MDETSSQDALALLNSLELMVAFPLGPLLSAYETEQKVVDPPEDDLFLMFEQMMCTKGIAGKG